jgi:hypothetical protein
MPIGDSTAPADSTRPKANQTASRNQSEAARQHKDTPPDAAANLIDDDGKALWVSPTGGPPIDLAYLGPGSQIVIALRPAAIARHPEAARILEALGPIGQRVTASLEQLAKVELAKLGRLVIGVETRSSGETLVTLVARAPEAFTLGKLARSTGQKLRSDELGEYIVIDDVAYFIPNGSRTTLVVAPESSIADIIALAGDPPPLRRDVERLLTKTDADRQVTIICTPSSLFSEGRSLFESELSRLREPLFWFLGDELSAVTLSLDWGDDFFYEIITVPTLETSPELAARILSGRLREVPERVKQYVSTLQPSEYGRAVVLRFPAMLEAAVAYARSGFDKDHAVLRGYLPIAAGHNLLLAAELTLLDAASQGRTVAEATAPTGASDESEKSVRERLQEQTSLRFARDSLEAALDQLSKDMGVEIVIQGPDLQADGITKNQLLAVDMENKLAEEILVEILRLANPDKTAKSLSDGKQKLVYVVRAGDDGRERIVVTTRAAASARGEELPKPFVSDSP